MNLQSLYGINNGQLSHVNGVASKLNVSGKEDQDIFSTLLNSAINNISETNSYLSDAENEKIKFAMGESENTHDLTIAMQKASTSLLYTIAVRDKIVEAYNTIMQMQI